MRPEIQELKFIPTNASNGDRNGWVIEVLKKRNKTVAYQTIVYPTTDPLTPVAKGWHAYQWQTNRLTCVGGFVSIKVFWDKKRVVTYKLAEHRPVVLTIPPGNPFMILNYHNEFARVMNHPDPLWEAERFKEDQYAWYPDEQQRMQNGEIFDLSEFIVPESKLPQTVDHP